MNDEDFDGTPMIFKSEFRFTIDPKEYSTPASRWWALGQLLLAVNRFSRRGVRYYWRVLKTGRKMRGCVRNAGV